MKSGALKTGELKARDIMKGRVVYATADMSVAELADLLQTHGVTGVPVVSREGKVTGVVSETDIVAAEAAGDSAGDEAPEIFRPGGSEDETEPEAIDYERKVFPESKIVEDIMTPWFVSVTEETPVPGIARKMVEEQVHRVLVMDSRGRLKGIVSAMDIVRLMAEKEKKAAPEEFKTESKKGVTHDYR